jgi:hypothetical protein
MSTESEVNSDDESKPSKWGVTATILVRITYAVLAAAVVIGIVKLCRGSYGFPAAFDLVKLIDLHGPAAVGIPIAAIAALFLVSLARALDGPMSFDLFGLRSEGAAATCLIWAILFLVIGLSFRALW